jgi:hypothetical protein
MGMFDTIDTEQVKCFYCNSDNYNIGDIVPCKEFNYSKDLLIMPFDTTLYDEKLQNYDFVIIKDSKVYEIKNINKLSTNNFKDIKEVISYMGTKVNINNYNDLINYIKDIKTMQLQDEINELENTYIDNYTPFKKKWLLG